MQKRPKVIVCQQASLDGRLTLSPDTLLLFGDARWSGAAGESQEFFTSLIAEYKPQVVLEGSGSFCRDDETPESLPTFGGDPAELLEDYLPPAVINRPGHKGWFSTVDSRGRIRWMFKEYPDEAWAGWYALSLVSRKTPLEYLAFLRREQIPYLMAGEDRVDLVKIVEKLGTQLGVTCIISQAGGRLNGALLRSGLVDEVHIDFFPALIGGTHTSSLFTSPDLRPDQDLVRLKLISAETRPDGHLWVHYENLHLEKAD